MKNLIMLLAVGSLTLGLDSCGGNRCVPQPAFWAENQVEGFKIVKENPQSSLRRVDVSWRQRPPFYIGTLPINYVSDVFEVIPTSISGGIGGIVVMDEFTDFRTAYVYPDSEPEKLSGIPIGAVSLSKDDKEIVAEAKLVDKTPTGIVIEEAHFEGGGACPTFTAKSLIGREGYKQQEIERTGRKRTEYYFIWPHGLQ
jgi:hypothetical protein